LGCQAGFCRLTGAPSLWRVFIITKPIQNFKMFSQMKIDLSELISVPEAAEMRGVSNQAIHQLMKRGRLTAIEVGGRKFLLRKEVEAFVPDVGGRPRKDSAAAKSSQGSKTAKRRSAPKITPGKKQRSR
jgi:excisionase family DNA binding protein